MKIENGKIVEATENELFDLYLKRGMDDIMDFNEYKRQMNKAVTIVDTLKSLKVYLLKLTIPTLQRSFGLISASLMTKREHTKSLQMLLG